ncbi:hypothetical protein MKW94_005251 [Papaver nudicaule]|uniref:DUF7953 domain-containing protein n=1 Tax=Papaver nudicaule TaxID=74823 RepID=A0AA42B1X3_PAPNU|nr:hypothetical protein [Papaver nudicaule]
MTRIRLDCSTASVLLISSILLFFPPGTVSTGIVTLKSIEIFTTHGFLSTPIFSSYGLVTAPTVYFNCQGENKTSLPDVKKRNSLYTFKGEESWQVICKIVNFYVFISLTADVVGRNHTSSSKNGDSKGKRMRVTSVIFIAVLASNGFIVGVLYRYWIRKKSMQPRRGRKRIA